MLIHWRVPDHLGQYVLAEPSSRRASGLAALRSHVCDTIEASAASPEPAAMALVACVVGREVTRIRRYTDGQLSVHRLNRFDLLGGCVPCGKGCGFRLWKDARLDDFERRDFDSLAPDTRFAGVRFIAASGMQDPHENAVADAHPATSAKFQSDRRLTHGLTGDAHRIGESPLGVETKTGQELLIADASRRFDPRLGV